MTGGKPKEQAEAIKAKRGRALNAVRILGSATPIELVDHMNAARQEYPKLPKVTKAQATKLLKELHGEDELIKTGDTYKPKEP